MQFFWNHLVVGFGSSSRVCELEYNKFTSDVFQRDKWHPTTTTQYNKSIIIFHDNEQHCVPSLHVLFPFLEENANNTSRFLSPLF